MVAVVAAYVLRWVQSEGLEQGPGKFDRVSGLPLLMA